MTVTHHWHPVPPVAPAGPHDEICCICGSTSVLTISEVDSPNHGDGTYIPVPVVIGYTRTDITVGPVDPETAHSTLSASAASSTWAPQP